MMGQGRKKCFQSGRSYSRRRSVHCEVEDPRTTTGVGHSGIASTDHSESLLLRYNQRDLTPLPTIQRHPRHDSLVDYMSLPTIVTGSIPTKEVVVESVDCQESIPMVSTTVVSKIPSTDCRSASAL